MRDVLVIGSGFGGSVAALRLAEKGYSVSVLEAGRRYRPEDFPNTNWSLRRYLWAPRLRCFGILRITALSDVLVLSGAGVGGGSLGYANTLLVPPEPFFRDPQWAGMADWRTVLEPHYAEARRMLGAARNERVTPADRVLREVAEAAGCAETFRMQDVGVFFGEPEVTVPDPYFGGQGPPRQGCRHCGGCMVGCRHGAKNTLDRNYLHLAEALGVEILPETTATLLREIPEGWAVDTFRTTSWLRRGRRTFEARQVVLAAGVLGTLPLLLRCREAGTLPRLSPMLGARVRTNSETLTGATARRGDVDYSEGVAITSSIYPDAVTHVEPVRYPAGSDVMSFLTTPLTDAGGRIPRPLRWLGNILRHPVDFLRVLWPFGWARRSVILLVMQTLDNSIRVFRRRRWWWPFRRSLVSEPEQRRARVPVTVAQAQPLTRLLAERMGGVAQSAINEVLLNTGITAHILGGCAIGPDPARGVVDGQGRVYGHEGLFVVDGSAVPANLGVNPSLTITALAEHAMSHVPPKR
ncbi:MAG: GMC family oxidoreductase [Deltaproteobacteria bacterium]|nr:GMC family oxidoreductase [Deltaproteobacteria bacterium]